MPTHQLIDRLFKRTQCDVYPTKCTTQNPPSQQIPQTDSGANNNIYNSGGFGGLQDANVFSAAIEPMAANALGGFSSW